MTSARFSNTAPLFELVGVDKHFGHVTALTDVTLRVWPGERVALVGPSGAGKSTLLSLLNGSSLPSRGTVRVLGHDLGRLARPARRRVQRQIGTVYQQFHLVPNLAVVHNVNAGHLGRWPFLKAAFSLIRPLDVAAARDALAQVGLPEKLYERTDTLSGGQQQRVALARVLVQDPVAILADEPVASLDPERGREVLDLMRDLSQRHHKTLVASLHLVEFARSHFDRLVGLRGGRVLFDAAAADVTRDMLDALYHIEAGAGL